jgi:hypothetical protein
VSWIVKNRCWNCIFAWRIDWRNLHEHSWRHNEDQDHCLKLRKTIYGLFQNASEFYKKLILMLKSIAFMENKLDPCLLPNSNGNEVILIGIHEYECLVIGQESASNCWLLSWKGTVSTRRLKKNEEYLSFHVTEGKELNQIVTLQTHLINNLRDMCCPDQDSKLIDPEYQSRNRSWVWMILYLKTYPKLIFVMLWESHARAWMILPWEVTLKCWGWLNLDTEIFASKFY